MERSPAETEGGGRLRWGDEELSWDQVASRAGRGVQGLVNTWGWVDSEIRWASASSVLLCPAGRGWRRGGPRSCGRPWWGPPSASGPGRARSWCC